MVITRFELYSVSGKELHALIKLYKLSYLGLELVVILI